MKCNKYVYTACTFDGHVSQSETLVRKRLYTPNEDLSSATLIQVLLAYWHSEQII